MIILLSQHRNRIIFALFCLLFLFSVEAKARLIDDLRRLKRAYPDHIQDVSEQYILWKDGSKLNTTNGKNFINQVSSLIQPKNYDHLEKFKPIDDWGRIRYSEFFEKMYGSSPKEVEKNLVVIYWMPGVFGHRYPLQVTRVNDVAKKLKMVSDELEKLPATYYKYLKAPEGTYCWRRIAHTNYLSLHSFGTTIDINREYSNYWQWDLERQKRRITESALLHYRNQIPPEIVNIFEKHGFFWGGRWYHYDTMHFEYRPELFNLAG